MNDSEVLKNINEELQKVQLELANLRKEHFPKQEFDEEKGTMELIKHNSKKHGVSIESYIQSDVVPKSRVRFLNLCKDEINAQTPIINKSNEFVEIFEDENLVDGSSFRVIKKSLPERNEVDLDLDIRNGIISRRRY